MSTEVAIPEDVTSDVSLIENLDTPEKRFNHLSKTFTSAIVVIAEMQKNEDWKHLKKDDGSSYKSLTDMVQDALGKSDSYARRLVQTVNEYYTPLEAVTVEGTVISISASEAAQLGTEGMNAVVSKVQETISEGDVTDPEVQAEMIQEIKGDVLKNKHVALSETDDFSDDDFSDINFDDALDDDDDFDLGSPAPSKKSSKPKDSDDFSDEDFSDGFDDDAPAAPDTKQKKKDEKRQAPSDYLGPIEKIMSGGREYKEESDIQTLPDELQEFVRAVNYLASLDSVALSEMITEERRGATYSIRKAASNLTLVVSATETSSWVLEQI